MMEFSMCSIAGVKYGTPVLEMPPEAAQYMETSFNFYDRCLHDILITKVPCVRNIVNPGETRCRRHRGGSE
jgi:hypothetical protein